MPTHRPLLAALLATMLLPTTLRAQQPPPDAPPSQRDYVQQQQDLQKLFTAGDYQKAADTCNDLLKKYPNDAGILYNLACAQARLKQPDDALATLEKAVKNGMTGADHMQKDDDLASIRDDKKFADILALAKTNDRARGKYEPGEDLPAVKTAEAFPDGGLRYRLRIPKDATPEKPAHLLIWLHPSGGSMNRAVEKLAPDLAAHGYALLVLTQKQFNGWTGEELNQLGNQTMADVKKHKEIDSQRPVLLGFSAGGQAALMLWLTKPSAFSGLILDAAYPVTQQGNKLLPLELPTGAENAAALKKTPIHAIVGAKDPGVRAWQKMENQWLQAGIPLTVTIVPDKAHTWMLTGAVLKDTYTWLDSITAGKLPADIPTAPATLPATQPTTAP